VLIEQAVFSSAKTDRTEGYQVLGRSAGLSAADVRELAVWGPSHGSLLERPGERSSTNFFTLASGLQCVSRTTVAGAEYSGRGGELVYTQFLVVPPEVMARFANDPFAILRAAAASGALCVHEPVPESLEPVALGGHAPVVDLGLIAQLARVPGPAGLATLIQTALASDRLAISSEIPCWQLIAGLLNVLPVECRTEFSFTTGLKFSPSRSVRISSLPTEKLGWRAIARRGITLLRLESNSSGDEVSWQGWAAWIAAILKSGKLSVLTAELEQARPGLTCADLNELGEQLLGRLRGVPPQFAGSPARPAPQSDDGAVVEPTGNVATSQRADAPHGRRQSGVTIEDRARNSHLDALAEKLADQPPEVLELLERIDDLVFAAISGDSLALAELETLWPQTAAELDDDLVEHSREQYLRCALSICSDFSENDVQGPERALSAVDVLCVLFEE
jgi:GTPase-associated protein 1, N-terminal domain type 2